jgi:LPXTG-motif cell wall-anchored protein
MEELIMKKLSFVLFAVLMVFGMTHVKAMTEDELYNALTQTVEIGGKEWSVDSSTKTYIQRYLNQYDVSSADADYINQRINTAISILKSEGTGDFKALSSSAKTRLKNLVSEISSNTSVKASVTNGSLVVYEPGSSNVFYEVSKIVKQTGSETNMTAIIAGISVLILAAGSVLVVKQVKQN